MEFEKSKTYQNLKKAFAGESEAHTKYQFYASQAKKDGYEQIKDIFEETAHNEKEHAKIWFKLLHNNEMPKTVENLLDGRAGEHYESSEMYVDFCNTAREEGYDDIADLFSKVAKIEKSHCNRYNVLLNNVRKNSVFHKNDKINWKCSNCGYEYIGHDAPSVCPVCNHPRAFFRENLFNYL